MIERNDHADVKVHPPILLLIHFAMAAALTWVFPFSVGFLPEWAGYPIAFLGSALGVSAIVQFGRANTTVDPHGSVSVVVTDGPYRFSRNPVYVGLVCLLIGMTLMFGSLWGLILAPLFILSLNHFVIRYEEAYLENKFKDEYADYKSRVRRWL